MTCEQCFGHGGDSDSDGMGGSVSAVCPNCWGSGKEPSTQLRFLRTLAVSMAPVLRITPKMISDARERLGTEP